MLASFFDISDGGQERRVWMGNTSMRFLPGRDTEFVTLFRFRNTTARCCQSRNAVRPHLSQVPPDRTEADSLLHCSGYAKNEQGNREMTIDANPITPWSQQTRHAELTA